MMLLEQWKSVDGFNGYEVSTEGRVRSYKNYRGGFDEEPHILKPRVNPNGYHIVVLYDEKRKPHQLSVHRIVANAFIPCSETGLVVDHIDANKTNNRVDNLEWVTNKTNSIRAVESGLYEPIFHKTRRPVVVTDLRNGEQTYYEGVNHASRVLGFSPSIISRAANMLVEKVGHYTIEFAGREDRLFYGINYL